MAASLKFVELSVEVVVGCGGLALTFLFELQMVGEIDLLLMFGLKLVSISKCYL